MRALLRCPEVRTTAIIVLGCYLAGVITGMGVAGYV